MKQIVKNWIMQAESDLNSAKYNLNGKKYDVAAYLDKSASRIIKELKKFKKKNKIDKLIFFGSRLNNKYTKYSDIDLIIVSPHFRKMKSFERAPILRLNWNLDYPVDMLSGKEYKSSNYIKK